MDENGWHGGPPIRKMTSARLLAIKGARNEVVMAEMLCIGVMKGQRLLVNCNKAGQSSQITPQKGTPTRSKHNIAAPIPSNTEMMNAFLKGGRYEARGEDEEGEDRGVGGLVRYTLAKGGGAERSWAYMKDRAYMLRGRGARQWRGAVQLIPWLIPWFIPWLISWFTAWYGGGRTACG